MFRFLRRTFPWALATIVLVGSLLAQTVPIVAFAGPKAEGPQAVEAQGTIPDLAPLAGRFVPGELLVRYRPGLPGTQVQALSVQHRITPLASSRGRFVERVSVAGDLASTLAALRADPRVLTAQPNWIHHFGPSDVYPRERPLTSPSQGRLSTGPLAVPDDGYYMGMDEFFEGAGPLDFQRWYLGDTLLRAESAWELSQGRSDVVVAVIDSGVDLDHPDLASNTWTNAGEIAANGIDDDQNGYIDDVHGWDFCGTRRFLPVEDFFVVDCLTEDNDPNPDLGDGVDNDNDGMADSASTHGTSVAGVIGALSDNSIFVAGVAWNVRIMPLKVFSDEGGSTDEIILSAIQYAVDNGADVINLSLGHPAFPPETPIDPLFEEAFAQARAAGVVVVASAGNDNSSTPFVPASSTHAISVGAGAHDSAYAEYWGYPRLRDPDGRAEFSNYGPFVDVVAPGVRLFTTYVYTVADANEFGDPAGTPAASFADGTSFSGPVVAGLAALIISRGRDLGVALTPDEVRSIIEGTTVDLPDDPGDLPNGGPDWDGNGRVDFLAALQAVPQVAAGHGPTAEPQSVTTSEDVALPLTLSGDDPDNDPLTFTVTQGPTHGALVGTAPNLTYTPAPDYNGPDSFTFTASDGIFTSPPVDVSITVNAVNDRPTAMAQSVSTAPNVARAITLQGHDIDPGTTLTFAIVSQPANGNLTGTGANRTYTPNSNYTGSDSFTFTVSDGTLTSDPATVSITVIPSAPPVVNATIRNPVYVGRAWTLSASFTDPDPNDTHTATIDWGDGTTSQVSVNQAQDSLMGSHMYATAGVYTIRVRVTDDKGVTGEDTIEIIVRPHPRLRR